MDESAIAHLGDPLAVGGDVRGARRYSDSDREAAYFLWRVACGRNLRAVARLTGVPYGTLDDWKGRDRWIERAEADDRELREVSLSAVQLAVRANLLPAVAIAVELMKDPEQSGMVRMRAVEWLGRVGGMEPERGSASTKRRAAVSPTDLETMSDEEIRKYLVEKLVEDEEDAE